MKALTTSDRAKAPDRWTLIRDAAVLQVKLVVDGLRDLLLVPASLIAAIASLIRSDNGRPGPQFYSLLRLGKRSERWIDLFGACEHAPEALRGAPDADDTSIDEFVARLERYVVEEYRRGGVTAQAKERIDRALDAIERGPAKSSAANPEDTAPSQD